ncbi:hypothetical protein ACMXYW_05675 [Neptuniibacter sp. QD48_55]|uniref:hypothetical protein n=1 Tax=Neptuniibacter sp. QD48_55 TaxID=3398212 RepID=UPI0039F4F877
MEWMVIVLIMMSLLGSMMWVMPTKKQKYQASLRLKAKALGFQIQLEKMKPPRAQGEMEPDERNMTAYRILREGLSREQKNSFNTWQVFRVESIANIGLNPGWCWANGERTLSEPQLDKLNALLEELPKGVFSLESTPAYVGVHWDEAGNSDKGEEIMESLYQQLKEFSEGNF